MIDEAKKDGVTPDVLKTQLKEFGEKLDNSEELKTLKTAVEKNLDIMKKQGEAITQLKDGNLINADFSVNKNVIREMIEKAFK